jgi:predicted MPP superfamily phosphohydrolase
MFRRIVAGIVFLGLLLFTLLGSHYYLALRLIVEPAWPAFVSSLLLTLLPLGAAAMLVRALSRKRPGALPRTLALIAYTWVGVAFHLLIVTAASDLVLSGVELFSQGVPADPLGQARGRAAVVIAIAGALSLLALHYGRKPPATRRVEIDLARWPEGLDGFRIVQISDIHIGTILEDDFAAEVTGRVNALEPDLIAVTGDLVDGRVHRVGHKVEPFRELRARHGIWFVTGNHDFYSGADEWIERILELGWTPLRNHRVTIEVDGHRFDLAGVDDRNGALLDPNGGEDLERALADRDVELTLLLLAHDPGTFKRASRRGVDLQLSGHTHGGQIWPFHWAVRSVIPWVAGLHRTGDSLLYVSRGTGFWGPPMRLGAPAEITELVLRRRQ